MYRPESRKAAINSARVCREVLRAAELKAKVILHLEQPMVKKFLMVYLKLPVSILGETLFVEKKQT